MVIFQDKKLVNYF